MKRFVVLGTAFAVFLVSASPAMAVLIWMGRDGKKYTSVKDCFTNNPQCLPEQARMASGPAAPTTAAAPKADMPAVTRKSAAQLCRSADGWMRQPPCKVEAGEAAVPVPN